MRILDEHRPSFAEKNAFLDMVLGLTSAARRVERIVQRAAREKRRSIEPEEPHTFDLFALGVISFSRRLLKHVEAAKQPVARSPASEDAQLRDLLL